MKGFANNRRKPRRHSLHQFESPNLFSASILKSFPQTEGLILKKTCDAGFNIRHLLTHPFDLFADSTKFRAHTLSLD